MKYFIIYEPDAHRLRFLRSSALRTKNAVRTFFKLTPSAQVFLIPAKKYTYIKEILK